MAFVEARDLTKHFVIRRGWFARPTVVRALTGVNLEIERRETLGVVGESGCGKSTLGRCLIRLIEPTSGQVLFDGEDVLALHGEELRSLRRRMQIVFQNPFSSLNPRMTVRDIVAEPLKAHTNMRGSELTARVIELLRQVGLNESHLYRYPREFSGGQAQRIAVARALALNPDFIVLDEPTSALDVSVQATVVNLLEELQAELGLTYLFISHDLSVVQHISNRIAVMYLGEIVEMGNAEEIFHSPMHPYTQALLSATPMVDPETRRERIILEGSVPNPANPPSGCHFHTRCPVAMAFCADEKPPLREINGRLVACHLHE